MLGLSMQSHAKPCEQSEQQQRQQQIEAILRTYLYWSVIHRPGPASEQKRSAVVTRSNYLATQAQNGGGVSKTHLFICAGDKRPRTFACRGKEGRQENNMLTVTRIILDLGSFLLEQFFP